MELNRFKQLLESTMGDAKPLIMERTTVTPLSNHVCDTDTTSKLHQGQNYKYCKNGEKYYFIGTTGEFKTKNPNWTESTGTGLESIKKMIGPVFDKM